MTLQTADPTINTLCIECNSLKHTLHIELVDELNQPVGDIPYVIKGRFGERKGTVSSDGIIHETELPAGPLDLTLAAQPFADEMEQRKLRIDRDVSDVKVHAEKEQADYRYVRIGELCDSLPEMKNWQQPEPPAYHFPQQTFEGQRFVLPSEQDKCIVEVCPFRAWVPLLYAQDDYNLVNAYNLSLMAILAYAEREESEHKIYSGSIEDFFFHQLLDLSKLPHKVNDQYFPLFAKDVPFCDAYNQLTFIDTPRKEHDTQMYYVSNPNEVIISWRGTASTTDALTDAKAYRETTKDFLEIKGEMHGGFKAAFLAANTHNPDFKENHFQKIQDLLMTRVAYICGHSLGGALATIHSFFLFDQKHSVNGQYLYTYAMPRVFNYGTVKKFNFPHYRHVNNRDIVTGAPWQSLTFRTPAIHDFIFFPVFYPTLFRSLGDNTSYSELTPEKLDEYYWHHGDLIHFTPSVYIQEHAPDFPIENPPEFTVHPDPDLGMKAKFFKGPFQDYAEVVNRPKIHLTEVKLLVAPSIIAKSQQPEIYQALIDAYQRHGGDDKLDQVRYNGYDHPSGEYSRFLLLRLSALIDEKLNQSHPWLERRSVFLNEDGRISKKEGKTLFDADLNLIALKDTLLNPEEDYLQLEKRFMLWYHHPDKQQRLKIHVESDAGDVESRLQEALQAERKCGKEMLGRIEELGPYEENSSAVFNPELEKLTKKVKSYQNVLEKLKEML